MSEISGGSRSVLLLFFLTLSLLFISGMSDDFIRVLCIFPFQVLAKEEKGRAARLKRNLFGGKLAPPSAKIEL
ncbi:hypothetical protein OIU84_023217 [Salix udensis]|uniref:Uncharacterized protein n=1 Tax=Salix udensis TaxID=889485 RepID=A0AAD6KQV7_9ROSI|nr:hypothetical protein OIU84_023217 [Salix udensis]